MRHKKLGRKLGVKNKHRKAMFRNMATELFRHDSIKTTDTRAKEIRRVAEKIITLAKDGSLHSRRRAASYIRDKQVLSKLFDSVAERYKDRPGGYTRIIKLGYRKGDNSPISLVELVKEEYKPKTKKKKSKSTKAKTETTSSEAKEEKTRSTKKESAKDLGLNEEKEEKGKIKETTADTVQAESPAEESEENIKKSAKAKTEKNNQQTDTETPENEETENDKKK